MIKNRLKEIRKKNNVTQLQLADAVLSTRQTIHAIENSKSVPSLELALKISDYLDVPVDKIFWMEKRKKFDNNLFSVFGH